MPRQDARLDPHKLLWETDWPSPGITRMRKNVDQFLGLPLSDSLKRAALETNPEKFLPAERPRP